MRQMTVIAFVTVLTAALLSAADAPVGGKPLFNGKDLTGWTLKPKKGEAESLDGKTEAAKGRFKVIDGSIVIDPKVKGDLIIESTGAELAGDLTIRFEFKPGPGCNNDLFFRGAKFDLKKPDINNLKEGEWNQFEIVAKADQLDFRCNGESQKIKKAAPDKPTPLGIRAEAGPVEIRGLEVKSK